jgi:hypothetical protein
MSIKLIFNSDIKQKCPQISRTSANYFHILPDHCGRFAGGLPVIVGGLPVIVGGRGEADGLAKGVFGTVSTGGAAATLTLGIGVVRGAPAVLATLGSTTAAGTSDVMEPLDQICGRFSLLISNAIALRRGSSGRGGQSYLLAVDH